MSSPPTKESKLEASSSVAPASNLNASKTSQASKLSTSKTSPASNLNASKTSQASKINSSKIAPASNLNTSKISPASNLNASKIEPASSKVNLANNGKSPKSIRAKEPSRMEPSSSKSLKSPPQQSQQRSQSNVDLEQDKQPSRVESTPSGIKGESSRIQSKTPLKSSVGPGTKIEGQDTAASTMGTDNKPIASTKELRPQEHKVAIKLTNICYKTRSTTILQNINMTILEGQIYGLLGPSGCGKTTLLKTIVGLNRPTSGTILVFNERPGTRNSIVPGPDVGFMPQDISLYVDFTVSETLNFFGRIAGLNKSEMLSRKEFMFKFLELPPAGRRIHYLSGGQKRRVSLAAALMQNPTFLILDEPTVGIDPVLRETIWKHLLDLTLEKKITIIITTHYIEEAQRAGRIAFMRQGCLLAEESPNALMEIFQAPSLELVFLKFCLAEGKCMEAYEHRKKTDLSQLPNATRKRTRFSCEGPKRTYALLIKNIIRTFRNIPNLFVQVIQPGYQMAFFCLCFGRKPEGLIIGVVDEDEGFSKDFRDQFNTKYITFKTYSEEDDARNAVKNGDAWGYLHFRENYTEETELKFIAPVGNWITENIRTFNRIVKEDVQNNITDLLAQLTPYNGNFSDSIVYYTGDYSSYPIKIVLTEQMSNASDTFFRNFLVKNITGTIPGLVENLGKMMKSTITSGKLQEQIEDAFTQKMINESAIYGKVSSEEGFLGFGVPGLVISQAYVLAASLTALAFLLERREGVLERGRIAGIKAWEFVVSHILLQLLIVLFQVISVLLVAYVFFQITQEGNLLLVGFITFLQGICGMSFGLLVSAVCTDEIAAITAVVGTYMPNMILSATLWPIEGIPKWIRYISYILPQTFACQAMRSITLRGWGITHMEVWLSIIIVLAWTAFYNVLAAVVFAYS